VQVDPIRPASRATGTKRLKLGYDELVSNVAFCFNLLRLCTEDRRVPEAMCAATHRRLEFSELELPHRRVKWTHIGDVDDLTKCPGPGRKKVGPFTVTKYPTSISLMTISILSSPTSISHIPYRYPG
jgi:hypothetical protein